MKKSSAVAVALALAAVLAATGITYGINCPEGALPEWMQCKVSYEGDIPDPSDPHSWFCEVCAPCDETIEECPSKEPDVVIEIVQTTVGGGSGGGSGGGGCGSNCPEPTPPVVPCWKNIVSTTSTPPEVEDTSMDLGNAYGGGNQWFACHKGIDIGCSPGSPVYAPCSGKAIASPDLPLGGNVVTIVTDGPAPDGVSQTGNSDNLKCSAGHMQSIEVATDDDVVAGETVIGTCGQTGELADWYHVHYEVWQPGQPNYGPQYLQCGSGPQANTSSEVHDPLDEKLSGKCQPPTGG